jgi:acylphosphatase
MIRVRVRYTGRVQGVGFRATCRSLARDARITGWVMNEHDGSVTLEAQGESGDVEAYLSRVRAELIRFIRAEDQSSVPTQPECADFDVKR